MPTEGDDDRLLLARQHRRSWLRRSCPDVRNRATALPLANSLLVDAVALCERSQALLTMLYRSTDRLRRRGPSMKNLAHSASFHSTEKIAPSKAGIKHIIERHRAPWVGGADCQVIELRVAPPLSSPLEIRALRLQP